MKLQLPARRVTGLGVWICAGLYCSAVAAADVYVCKGPGGVRAFQQEPCGKNSKQEAHGTYDLQPDAPSQDMAPASTEPMPRTTAGAVVVQSPTAYSQPSSPAAYRCQAGARTWMQSTPCPATYVHGEAVTGIQGTTTSGQHVQGNGWAQVESPVQQQALDKGQACANVGNPGTHIAHSGQADVYERNIAKDKYCH